jgi:phosphoadenosine phosphosulfate reductase
MDVDVEFLAQARNKLTDADVFKILKWTKKTFGNNVAMTTAFGYGGVVLLHHVLKIIPDLKVYFIDTGFHFKETIDFCNRIIDEWNLNLEIIKPTVLKTELEKKIGDSPYKLNPDLCCHYCKVEPLLRVLHNHSAWLSGLRRDQSRTRAEIEIIEMDGRGTIKIYPLAHWTKEQTWKYIKKNNLPYHPLHDKDYLSIGCKPCTKPIKAGGDERDGRWPDMQKLECGIHLHKNKNKSKNF